MVRYGTWYTDTRLTLNTVNVRHCDTKHCEKRLHKHLPIVLWDKIKLGGTLSSLFFVCVCVL
jgi:hypothetical protein